MKDKFLLGLKGFFIGLANIIPGVSGGTMAITFGIYEELISIASNIFKNFKKNMLFLFPVAIGAILSIALFSNIITICLDKYKVATPLLFLGLILGGVPLLFKKLNNKLYKISNMISFLITIVFMFILYLCINNQAEVNFDNINIIGYLLLFFVGVIAAVTMVVPGISGSFVLILIGYYEPIIKVISDITKFNNLFNNFLILFPFGIGVLVGIITVSKIIKFCLNKYPEQTYSSIIAFVLSSSLLIIIPLIGLSVSIIELIIGLLLMILGAGITYKMEG